MESVLNEFVIDVPTATLAIYAIHKLSIITLKALDVIQEQTRLLSDGETQVELD